ncbi:MAG: helix-turn-helix transcriptional regulator [Paracoccaceae bacterium]
MREIVTIRGRVSPTADGSKPDDAKVARFLVSVGERVRNARTRMGISRRVLSEMSGVSQRYLAQLESGQGNISIGLLMRIADALDFGIEWLVSDDDPWNSETARASYLLRGATKDQRERIFRILEPGQPKLAKANRIALIGLRGAGKSTLGRLAASALGLHFLELNDEIEQTGGMPVNEIIELYGQEGYRLLERQAVERVAATHDSLILAVAGGIVSQPETFNYLLRHYYTVWLKAAPEEHMQRVRAQGDERPMAGNPDAMNELRSILTSREVLYSKADARVNTSNATVEESLAELSTVIEKNAFLEN